MLTAGELTSARAVVTSALPGTAVVTRATWTADGFGGSTSVWAGIGTVVARVDMNGAASEGIIGGGGAYVAPFVATLPHGTTVAERDRLVTGGRTLEIVGLSEPRDWSLSVRAECKETR